MYEEHKSLVRKLELVKNNTFSSKSSPLLDMSVCYVGLGDMD